MMVKKIKRTEDYHFFPLTDFILGNICVVKVNLYLGFVLVS